jgi:CIC family chloride channel protein
VLTEKIARRGLHLTREYSTDPLETFFAREVMTTDPVVLTADATLGDVLPATAAASTALSPVLKASGPAAARSPVLDANGSTTALYPVLDAGGAISGVVTHRELLAAAGREPAGRTVGELARPPKTLIRADQTLREVANAFAVSGTTRAPVIDPADPGHLVGMVSLAQLLHARRADHHKEHHRQRHLALRIPTETAAAGRSAG